MAAKGSDVSIFKQNLAEMKKQYTRLFDETNNGDEAETREGRNNSIPEAITRPRRTHYVTSEPTQKDEVARLEKQLTRKDLEKSALESQIRQLEKQNTKLREQLQTAQQQINTAQESDAMSRQQLLAFSHDWNAEITSREKMGKDLNTEKHARQEAEEEVEKLKRVLSEYEELLNKMLNSTSSEAKHNKKHTDSYKEPFERTTQRNKELANDLHQKDEYIKVLQNQIQELKLNFRYGRSDVLEYNPRFSDTKRFTDI